MTPDQPVRGVRVFISSTFRDMHAERDELVKRVFPELRRRCEARGVTFAEVDLRWGITDEAAAEGKVLPICLEEIRRCRPYFIGLLGERYGWVPDEIDTSLRAQEPWLERQRAVSVTELEILHGVLNDPSMASCAFFYFRDPAWVARQPDGPHLVESATPDEVKRLGPAEAQRRAADRRNRLSGLKDRIRASGLPLRENYSDAVTLGEWVLAELGQAIDNQYPPDESPDPVKLATAEHRRFAVAHAGAAVVRHRPHGGSSLTPFEAIDRHVQGDGAPLVILAPEGAGKTTLLAAWCSRFREFHPDRALLEHYTGATHDGGEWEGLARRIAAQSLWSEADQARVAAIAGDDAFDGRNVMPRTPEALREFVAAALQSTTGSPLVLVVDGVDRFVSAEGRPALDWLSPVVSSRVRTLLSACPGPVADELVRRGWATLDLAPLDVNERLQFVNETLARHAKLLAPTRTRRIADVASTASPLFLGTLLDELRLHGEHETLDSEIDASLRCTDVVGLSQRMIARCEHDYERHRPGMVRDALSLLWAARRGLSEPELLDLLGTGGAALPHGHWAPLRLALDRHLVDRRGRLSFLHDGFRAAVERRYLDGGDARRAVRLRLADYFRARGWQARAVDEVPWQLSSAGAWSALVDVLSDPVFLTAAWVENDPAPSGDAALLGMLLPPAPASEVTHVDVLRYWALAGQHTRVRVVDAYRPALAAPADHRQVLLPLARLLAMTGHDSEAASLRSWLVQWSGDARIRARALVDEANALGAAGRLEAMVPKLGEAEQLFRELSEPDGILACVGNRALVLQHQGDLDGALVSHREVEFLARRRGNRPAIATALQNQAWIASARGRHADAVLLYERAVQAAEDSSDHRLVAAAVGNLGAARFSLGDAPGAEESFSRQVEIARGLNDGEQEITALGRLAGALEALGRVEEAASRLTERCARAERLGRADVLYDSHRARLMLFGRAGRTREAIAAAREALAIAERFGRTEECRQLDLLIQRMREGH